MCAISHLEYKRVTLASLLASVTFESCTVLYNQVARDPLVQTVQYAFTRSTIALHSISVGTGVVGIGNV